MSASRSTIVFSLIFLAFLIVVWRPWDGLSPQVRVPPLGVDATDHNSILLRAEVFTVTFRPNDNNLENAWKNLSKTLLRHWNVDLVSLDRDNGTIRFEVGSAITSTQLENLWLDGQILEVLPGGTGKIVGRSLESLRRRLDPYGLRGDRIRKIGENLVLVETAKQVPAGLLTTSGRLEIFVDEDLAATQADIIGFGRASEEGGLGLVPLYFTSEGRTNFNSVVIGRQNSFLLFFLDRPGDGVLVFDPDDLKGLKEFFYDGSRGLFVENSSMVAINVTAFASPKDSMSDNLAGYLAGHFGEKVRVILMGSRSDFSAEFIGRIPSSYIVQFVERGDSSEDEWLKKALGLLLIVPVSPSLAENGVAEGSGLNIPVTGGISEAVDLRRILLNPLPARLDILISGQAEAEERLSSGILFLACISPAILISVLLLTLSRSARIALLFLAFNFALLVIALGLFSLLGVHLTVTSSIAAVVLSALSVVCSLRVTGEMLGGFRPVEGAAIGWRRSRAIQPVHLAAFMLSLALIAVSLSGMRFILPLSVSAVLWLVILAVFGVPAYSSMLERAVSKKEKAQKAEGGAQG